MLSLTNVSCIPSAITSADSAATISFVDFDGHGVVSWIGRGAHAANNAARPRTAAEFRIRFAIVVMKVIE